MSLTVKLLADEYDQLQPDKDGRISKDSTAVRRLKGQLFEARDQAEYDRLTRIPARSRPGQPARSIAVDPDKEIELLQSQLDTERARIDAAQAELDAQKATLTAKESGADPRDASQLAGKDLAAALERFGLDDSGRADDKRKRVQEYLDANPDASLTPAE